MTESSDLVLMYKIELPRTYYVICGVRKIRIDPVLWHLYAKA